MADEIEDADHLAFRSAIVRLHLARRAYTTAQAKVIETYKALPPKDKEAQHNSRFIVEAALPGTPKEIAQRLGIDQQRVYRLLDSYERRLLISHHGPPRNRVYQVRIGRWQTAFDSDEKP